jgi:hypothetical protein
MAITISGSGITSANIADGAITASDINSAVELGVTDAEKVNLKSGRNNLIINGGFDVNQRGVTFPQTVSASTATFSVDRWLSYGSATSVSVSVQDVTLPDGTIAKSHKTVANGTSAWLHPYQKVEKADYFRGKTVTLSAWVRTNLSDQKLRICDSTTCVTLGSTIPSDGDWHYVEASHTMPNPLSSSPTDVIQFHACFGGTTVNTNDYIEFALPQMELGSVATDFEHRSYGEELALCQRYFLATPFAGAGVYNTDASFFCMIGNGVPFRTIPSISSKTGVWTNINIEKSDTYDISAVTFQHNVSAPLFNERPLISFTVPTRSGYAGQGGVAMMDRNSDLFYFDAEL